MTPHASTTLTARRVRTSFATASLICVVVAAASACGSSGSASETAPAETSILAVPPKSDAETTPDLLLGTWIAESFITVGALQPIPAAPTVRIRFDDSFTAQVDTGCSAGTASVTFGVEDTFELSELTLTTKDGCDDTAREVERHLVELLGHPLTWGVTDGQLKLLPTDVTDSGLLLGPADSTVAPTEVANLLATAANDRIRMANGFDTPNVFSSVAIVDSYGTPGDDDTLDAKAGAVTIADDVRRAIEVALGPISVQWVHTADEVQSEPTATWDEVPLPAVLTLAEPRIDGDSATVISDLRCGPGCVIGGGQQFELGADGSWTLVGPIGEQWQS